MSFDAAMKIRQSGYAQDPRTICLDYTWQPRPINRSLKSSWMISNSMSFTAIVNLLDF